MITPRPRAFHKWMNDHNIDIRDFDTVRIDGNGLNLSGRYSAELAITIQEALGMHSVAEENTEAVSLFWKRGLIYIELFL